MHNIYLEMTMKNMESPQDKFGIGTVRLASNDEDGKLRTEPIKGLEKVVQGEVMGRISATLFGDAELAAGTVINKWYEDWHGFRNDYFMVNESGELEKITGSTHSVIVTRIVRYLRGELESPIYQHGNKGNDNAAKGGVSGQVRIYVEDEESLALVKSLTPEERGKLLVAGVKKNNE